MTPPRCGLIAQALSCCIIGRIHGAIVATTVGAIVAAIVRATIVPTGCGDDRPVYTPYYSLR